MTSTFSGPTQFVLMIDSFGAFHAMAVRLTTISVVKSIRVEGLNQSPSVVKHSYPIAATTIDLQEVYYKNLSHKCFLRNDKALINRCVRSRYWSIKMRRET